jgi:hypothetical protein
LKEEFLQREQFRKEAKNGTNGEAKMIKSNDFTRSNREKYNTRKAIVDIKLNNYSIFQVIKRNKSNIPFL